MVTYGMATLPTVGGEENPTKQFKGKERYIHDHLSNVRSWKLYHKDLTVHGSCCDESAESGQPVDVYGNLGQSRGQEQGKQ